MPNRMIASVIALSAMASSQTAQAQAQACVAPADLSDAVIYAMPIAFDAARTACANRLTRSGFMATEGDAYIAQFRSQQDNAWPGAFRTIKTFMAEQNKAGDDVSSADIGPMIANMPESALRPFLDAMVGQMIAEEIKPDSCVKIERGLELISPLPTDNVGGLITFLLDVTDIKNAGLCIAAQAAPKR